MYVSACVCVCYKLMHILKSFFFASNFIIINKFSHKIFKKLIIYYFLLYSCFFLVFLLFVFSATFCMFCENRIGIVALYSYKCDVFNNKLRILHIKSHLTDKTDETEKQKQNINQTFLPHWNELMLFLINTFFSLSIASFYFDLYLNMSLCVLMCLYACVGISIFLLSVNGLV